MEVIKTVKQHSVYVKDIDELKYIAQQYKNVKNYIYARFSGINSIPLINNHRQMIRDEWVKTKFATQWKLPARYWKLALDEAVSNIKTQWSNVKHKIKDRVNNNENLTKEELHYVRYVLKSNDIYYKILVHKEVNTPDKFKTVRFKYINNLIRRLSRRYKDAIPYSQNANGFTIDANMYGYKQNDGKLYIEIMSTKNSKRIKVYITDKNIYTGNLKVMIKDNRIEIHRPLKIQSKKLTNIENIIGVDKGYRYLLAVSNGKCYGENLNDYLNKETERLKEVNAKRNQLYNLEKKCCGEGNITKAQNILNNNLGKIKYNRNKQKHDAQVKTYINQEINKLFKNDKPSELVMEQLDFVNWNDRYPKLVKRKLARWIKGYIKERLEYKCSLNEVIITYINPAYTSKFCSKCGRLGKREGDIFICPICGEIHADYNASINILNRKNDKQITLYTPYKQVKQILLSRVS